MRPAGLAWFAMHEARLAWRDMRLLSGRGTVAILALLTAAAILHLVALLVVHPEPGLATNPTRQALTVVTGMLAMSFSLMLSQAMESVTRAFYTRGDLELILSSPVTAWRLFAVRIGAMAATVALMALALTAPFIHILAWRGGARFLSLYAAVVALAMLAVAVAIVLVAALFRVVGPKRTRTIAQIASAFIGAGFAVGLQVAAIQSFGVPDRLAFLRSAGIADFAPDSTSPVWGLARAAMGAPVPLTVLVALAIASLGAAIAVFAPRFGHYVLLTGGVAHGPSQRGGTRLGRTLSPAQALRRKEWALLRRDPWSISQTLVQILYLLPAAYLLWLSFRNGLDAATLLVPVLITAAGQFAGGLAWLAISGEDAPDLIATAPVPASLIVRAKFEATIGGTLMVFCPLLLGLFLLSPVAGLAASTGIVLATASATGIQYWYRLQAHRGRLRRRQTASRFTTYAEALASVSWAAAATLAAAGQWLSVVPACVAATVVFVARLLSPSRR